MASALWEIQIPNDNGVEIKENQNPLRTQNVSIFSFFSYFWLPFLFIFTLRHGEHWKNLMNWIFIFFTSITVAH